MSRLTGGDAGESSQPSSREDSKDSVHGKTRFLGDRENCGGVGADRLVSGLVRCEFAVG